MEFEPARWRLMSHPAATGAWNMAVDEAIILAVGRGEALPTLRLYAWNPPCLSLGYAQPVADADLPRLNALGWGLVRRPTGGRAILHTDELTYSVIAPLKEPRVAGTVLASYNRLAQALLRALNLLRVEAESKETYAAQAGADRGNPVCFEVPSNYEITVNGHKLVGSAQARRKEGVLQHGALPLHGDLARIVQALSFPDEAARVEAAERLLAHAATLETALGRAPSWEEAAAAMQTAFEQALNITFEPGDLSDAERADAERLVREKYAHPDWTGRL